MNSDSIIRDIEIFDILKNELDKYSNLSLDIFNSFIFKKEKNKIFGDIIYIFVNDKIIMEIENEVLWYNNLIDELLLLNGIDIDIMNFIKVIKFLLLKKYNIKISKIKFTTSIIDINDESLKIVNLR